jgi:hypothetical protein
VSARRTIAAGLAAAALLVNSAVAQASGRYVVEFRARSGGIFGHAYIAYGQVDGRGRLLHPRYAGFYPSGILEDTPLLAVLATPSLTSFKPRDRTMRSEMVYRREISRAMYAALPGEVRELRRDRPLWHLTFYNCNSFVADVAEWMRLRVPPTLQLPKDFVRGLYVLNRRSAPGFIYAQASATGRVAQPSDMLFRRAIGGEPIDR